MPAAKLHVEPPRPSSCAPAADLSPAVIAGSSRGGQEIVVQPRRSSHRASDVRGVVAMRPLPGLAPKPSTSTLDRLRAGDHRSSRLGSRQSEMTRFRSATDAFPKDRLLEEIQDRYTMAMRHKPVPDAVFGLIREGNRRLLAIDDPALRDGKELQRPMLDALGRPQARPFQGERDRGAHIARVTTALDVVGLFGTLVAMFKGIEAGTTSVGIAGVLLVAFPFLTTAVVNFGLTGAEMKDRDGVISRTSKLKDVAELAGSIDALFAANDRLRAAVDATEGVTGDALDRAWRDLENELLAHTMAYEASHRRDAVDDSYVESRRLGANVAAARQVATFPAALVGIYALSRECKGGYGAVALVVGAVVLARVAQILWTSPAGQVAEAVRTLEGIGANTRIEAKADIGSALRDWREQRMWTVGDKLSRRLNPVADEIAHSLGVSVKAMWAFEDAGGFFQAPVAPRFDPLLDQPLLDDFHRHVDGLPIDIASLPRTAPIDHDMRIDGKPLAEAAGAVAELAVLTQLEQVQRRRMKASLLAMLRRTAHDTSRASPSRAEAAERVQASRTSEWTLDALRFDPDLRAMLDSRDPVLAHALDTRLLDDVDAYRQAARGDGWLAPLADRLDEFGSDLFANKSLDRYVDQLIHVAGLQAHAGEGRLEVVWNSPEIRAIRDNEEFMALVNGALLDPPFDAQTTGILRDLRDKYVYRTTLAAGDGADAFNEPDRRTMLRVSSLAGRKGLGKSVEEEGVERWLAAKAKTSTLSHRGWKHPTVNDPEEDERRRLMSLTPLEHATLMALRARPSISAAERTSGLMRTDIQLALANAGGPCAAAMAGLRKLESDPALMALLRDQIETLRDEQLDEGLRQWNMRELGPRTKRDVLRYMVEPQPDDAARLAPADRPATDTQVTLEATRVRANDPGYNVPSRINQVSRQFWFLVAGAGMGLALSVGLGYTRRVDPEALGHCVIGQGPDERELFVMKIILAASTAQLLLAVYNAKMATGAAVKGAALRGDYYLDPPHARRSGLTMARQHLPMALTFDPLLFNLRTSVTGPRVRRQAAVVRELAFARLDALAGASRSAGRVIDMEELMQRLDERDFQLPPIVSTGFDIDLEAAMHEAFAGNGDGSRTPNRNKR